MTDALHLACAAEGGYVAHSAAMIHSVIAHAGRRPVRVHYLHGPGFPDAAAASIAAMAARGGATVSFLAVESALLEGLPIEEQFTAAMWHRLFLPDLLPDVERVLYLDCDTIAMSALEDLWKTDLEGAYLAAVTNVFEERFLHRPAELGLEERAYFNSGVLLLNLTELRRDGCAERLRRYAVEEGPRLLWPDQDALNVVLGARRVPLHPRWNCMNSVMEFPQSEAVLGSEAVELARRRPGIRHFEGPGINKPWHFLCQRRFREAYFEHRRQTPWPRTHREGVTPANVARRAAQRLRGSAATP